MSFSIEIEADTGIAIGRCSGDLQVQHALTAVKALWADPDWPGRAVVWDFREARFDLGSPDVSEVARFVLGEQRDPPPSKVVFVVARDVDFGLGRMFEAYRQDRRTETRVLRDYDEALRWARSADRAAG